MTCEDIILLIEEEEEPVERFAAIKSPFEQEDHNAGVRGFKAGQTFELWAEEYDGQPIVEYRGKRYPVRRVFGPRPDGKVELHTEEKRGVYRGGD